MIARQLVTLEGAQSALRVTTASALSQATVTGFWNAAEEGHALTQLQQEHVLAMTLMAYRAAVDTGERQLETEASLLRRSGRAAQA